MRRSRLAERYYTDKATITRSEQYKTTHGETRLQPNLLIYEDVPCRISQRTLPTNSQTESANEIRYETKLFLSPEYEIKQGDVIFIERGSARKRYVAGEPFLYGPHQEISLQRKERA